MPPPPGRVNLAQRCRLLDISCMTPDRASGPLARPHRFLKALPNKVPARAAQGAAVPSRQTRRRESSERVTPESAAAPQSIELTILMPCLNEAETLATCIRKAQTFLASSGIAGEVLV